jgi:hypothetical protein
LNAGLLCGDAAELLEHFAALRDQGVERFYVWFADFATPDTLTEFAATAGNRRILTSLGTSPTLNRGLIAHLLQHATVARDFVTGGPGSPRNPYKS